MPHKLSYFRYLARLRRKLASVILSKNYLVINVKDVPNMPETKPTEQTNKIEMKVYANDLIKFTNIDIGAPSKGNILLLQNTNNVTPYEKKIYEEILNNEASPASVFSVLLIENEDALNSGGIDLLTSVVERLPSVSKQQLSNFSFIVAVNSSNEIPLAFRQSDSKLKLVVVQTCDFDVPINSEVVQNSDLFVTNRHTEYDVLIKHLRNVHTYINNEDAFESLQVGMRSLLPKEFNVLLPAWNCDEVIPDFGSIDTSSVDIVLWLDCSEKDLPHLESNFSDFIFDIVSITAKIAVTEDVWSRYSNFINNIDVKDFRALFIIRAAEDGARFEVKYV